MTKTRPRQLDRAAFGELDEIVVQLFDDLANGNAPPRNVVPTAERNGSAPRNLRRENDRSVPVSTAETARSPADVAGSRSPEKDASESQPFDSSARHSASDDEELFSDEPRYQDETASFTPEEEEFVKHTVAWLAPRPNADLLLERIWEVLLQQEADVLRRDAAEIDGGDGSARSPPAVKVKPAATGKRA